MDNKKKNNDRKKCPVCGRFASAEAVSKHDALVKGNKAMRQTLDELKAERDTLKASVSAYETDNDELRKQAGRMEKEIAGLNERLKKRGEEITVKLRGGDLHIVWKADGTVMMTGSATHVFDGEIDITGIA